MIEEIVSFATGIIANGVKSGLTEEQIRNNLEKYTNYLKNQDYANEKTTKVLNDIVSTLPELMELVPMYDNRGLANIILNKEHIKQVVNEVPNIPKSAMLRDRCGNVVTDRCGSPSTSSCGGGRSLGRSSC